MPRIDRRAEWCVMDMQTHEAACQRCAGREPLPPFPVPITAFALWTRYFIARHRYCRPKEPHGPSAPHPAS
jgi:hypothetical protein